MRITNSQNNNNLLIWLLIAITLLLLTSCDITKQAAKTKTDKDLTEKILTKTIRVGDTVRYEVPKVILKDTTIYTYNRQGSTLVTKYDSKGDISAIECLTSNIDLLIQENRRLSETVKEKQKEKTENFDAKTILYFMIGLGLLLIIGGALFIYTISKQLAPLTKVIETIGK